METAVFRYFCSTCNAHFEGETVTCPMCRTLVKPYITPPAICFRCRRPWSECQGTCHKE